MKSSTRTAPRVAAVLATLLGLLVPLLGFGTSAHAAPTGFRVQNGRLLEANGNDFVMRGVNHAHTWYPSRISSISHIKAKRANTVRVVLANGDRWARNDTADVANVVSQCKRNRLICVLEVHDTTGYGDQSGATTLSRAADYWISVKSALTGQESYVIVNIGNEPIGNNNASRWTADTKAAIQKLRNAGFNHTLMVDAPNWGQDWSFIMRDNAASVFAADRDRNTVFSVHMYGVYNTAAKVNDYLNRFVAAKLPIVVGEFGFNHSDGNPDEDAILAAAQRLGIGYLGWSWSGNGSDVQYLDLVTNFDPNRLTSWGQRLFNGANGIAATAKEASVYSGAARTTAPAAPLTTPLAER
ncbi:MULTISPECIES: glycoside hydrolase family 5 protein [unclassified Streptomyces]|uniref:glycoside hydrolase family 5 protein n=1 Tax=unclassified Streptomyces TaxID=2593676 RepID=UPI003334A54D